VKNIKNFFIFDKFPTRFLMPIKTNVKFERSLQQPRKIREKLRVPTDPEVFLLSTLRWTGSFLVTVRPRQHRERDQNNKARAIRCRVAMPHGRACLTGCRVRMAFPVRIGCDEDHTVMIFYKFLQK
jgi:hypothetical protein